MQIFAPFTPVQVLSINAYQKSGVFHPFTCGSDQVGHNVDLLAQKEGMYCPKCSYIQNWVYDWMADWSWKRLN